MNTQNALPGQSGIATANELDQFNNPFPIPDPNDLVWSTSNPSITAVAVGDGTPSAKVSIGQDVQPGTYTVTFHDPAAPSIPVTAGTIIVVQAQAVAASGSVDLGTFA